jgi:8-oxo-dGTP pyrophosphatase MutT (NUDIX family)
MKIADLTAPKLLVKAGLVPFVVENGVPVFMFMVPSNPLYGGSLPSIAKGNVDPGESFRDAAIREAEEELGLKVKNIADHGNVFPVWNSMVSGDDSTYSFHVFACRVKNKYDFNEPHFETGSTHWLTNDEFREKGRKLHVSIVDKINSKVLALL